MTTIPFIDMQTQRARISERINDRMARVLEHGQFILGPEVGEFERELARFERMNFAYGCANGTDAIVLALKAWDIGPGDAVFCPSFTYTATAEAIVLVGATPVFVDVERDSYLISFTSLEEVVTQVRESGELTPKAVIAVDLFGRIADYPALRGFCAGEKLKLISDCAQGIGCRVDGNGPGLWADAVTTSFFPAKPLGCYGDGGAIMTNEPKLDAKYRALAFHGRSDTPFDHDAIGMNSRLDTLQAAILLEKLAIFPDEIISRQKAADAYNAALKSYVLRIPELPAGETSSWAQYTMEVTNRDHFMQGMRAKGIPVAAYYPRPVHQQTAYVDFPVPASGLPNTEAAAQSVVSLPMHAYLDEAVQGRIIDAAIATAKENTPA